MFVPSSDLGSCLNVSGKLTLGDPNATYGFIEAGTTADESGITPYLNLATKVIEDGSILRISQNSIVMGANVELFGPLQQRAPHGEWTTLAEDTFELASPTVDWVYLNSKTNEIESAPLSRCPETSTNQFLGGPGKLGLLDTLTRSYVVPPYKQLRMSFNMHYFDQWTDQEGVDVFLKYGIDNDVLEHDVNKSAEQHPMLRLVYKSVDCLFTDACSTSGIDVCGGPQSDKLAQYINFGINEARQTEQQLTFTFRSHLNLNKEASSWGMDNVELHYIAY